MNVSIDKFKSELYLNSVVIQTRTREEYTECMRFLKKILIEVFSDDAFDEYGENTCLDFALSRSSLHYGPRYFFEENHFYGVRIVTWPAIKKHYEISTSDYDDVKIMKYEEAKSTANFILETKSELEKFLSEHLGKKVEIIGTP